MYTCIRNVSERKRVVIYPLFTIHPVRLVSAESRLFIQPPLPACSSIENFHLFTHAHTHTHIPIYSVYRHHRRRRYRRRRRRVSRLVSSEIRRSQLPSR